MFGGIDPKQMGSMMKKMGIKTQEISASEVIIKTSEGNIVITNPTITAIEMQGQKSFQITGDVSESGASDGDVEIVMEQTGAGKEEAKKALEETNGDIAEAILKLKK